MSYWIDLGQRVANCRLPQDTPSAKMSEIKYINDTMNIIISIMSMVFTISIGNEHVYQKEKQNVAFIACPRNFL